VRQDDMGEKYQQKSIINHQQRKNEKKNGSLHESVSQTQQKKTGVCMSPSAKLINATKKNESKNVASLVNGNEYVDCSSVQFWPGLAWQAVSNKQPRKAKQKKKPAAA